MLAAETAELCLQMHGDVAGDSAILSELVYCLSDTVSELVPLGKRVS